MVHVHEPPAPDVPLTELYRLPGDTPSAETMLPPGALVTAVALPPLPFARRSRTARSATGPRSRSRSARSRPRSTWTTARCATCGWPAAGSRPGPGGRTQAERALRGGRATEAAFRAAADAELAAARPLPDNAFKVPLVRNLTAARARRAGAGVDR